MTQSEHAEGAEPIGIDGDGARHEYDPDAGTVRVYDPAGDLEHEQRLDDRPVADWIDYIAEKRGWQERRLLTARDLFGER